MLLDRIKQAPQRARAAGGHYNILLCITTKALVEQLQTMSDIASTDLFNIAQAQWSWCFWRNSNRNVLRQKGFGCGQTLSVSSRLDLSFSCKLQFFISMASLPPRCRMHSSQCSEAASACTAKLGCSRDDTNTDPVSPDGERRGTCQGPTSNHKRRI